MTTDRAALHFYRFVYRTSNSYYLSSDGLEDPGCRIVEVEHGDLSKWNAATKVRVKLKTVWSARNVIHYSQTPVKMNVDRCTIYASLVLF